jgi:hypothetical protein
MLKPWSDVWASTVMLSLRLLFLLAAIMIAVTAKFRKVVESRNIIAVRLPVRVLVFRELAFDKLSAQHANYELQVMAMHFVLLGKLFAEAGYLRLQRQR